MTVLSIPALVMAVIAFYVSGYHLLIYFRRPESRVDLTFALTAMCIGFYDVFCVALYNASSPLEGVQIQRWQLISLSLLSIAYVWFIVDYASMKSRFGPWLFSIIFLIFALIGLFDKSGLAWTNQPLIKNFQFPYFGWDITYYEMKFGKAMLFEAFMLMVFYLYLYLVAVHFYWNKNPKRAKPLVLALGLFLLGMTEDVFVALGYYSFIYTIEYSFLGMVLVMAYTLSSEIVERGNIRQELQDSEEKYRSLYESSRDAIMTLAPPTWLFTSGNPATVQLFKVKDEAEFISLGPWQLSPEIQPDGRPSDEKAKEMIGTAMRNGSNFFEWTHCHSDGTPFPAEVLLTRMEQGGQVLLQATVRDITERKKVEESLINSERKWRNVLVNTPQIGISLDPDAKIVFANAHFLELTGWQEEEVVGKNWFDLFIPENIREEIRNVFSTVMSEKDTIDFSTYENDIVTKTGELRNVSWSNVLTKDAQGNIVDVTCLGIDLTERRAAQEKLLKQKKLFETMFNTISDGVIITNTQREIQLANKGMESTFGYKPEALLGKSTEMLYADKDKYRETGAAVFDKNAEKPGDLYITYYRDKSGREFPGETFGAKLFDENNIWIGNLGIMRDITERKQMEEERMRLQNQLMQAQKIESIGNLAGGIAHDFNNILSAIIGFTELALDEVDKNTTAEDNLQEVYTAGKRARDLVKQILAFARQSDEEIKPVQISVIAKEVLKFIRSTIPTSIELKQSIESNAMIMGNPIQVHQILMNLCTNAAHAMEDRGGTLEVCLKDVVIHSRKIANTMRIEPGEYIEIKVSDTGTGISPDILESIFEPYFTTKKPGEGTGMGLATVQGIVEAYGGKITVDSSLGEGTILTIYLPTTRKTVADRIYVPEDVPTGTERILFVDDEEAIAKMGSQILEGLGYAVTTRTSSVEALNLFRAKANDFDLVITDMTMPNMTGDLFAAEVMKIRSNIPVILCTGYSKKISDETASEIGIKAFAYKPIVKADLAKTVRKVLDEVNKMNIEDGLS